MGEIKNQNSGPSSEEGTDPPKSKRLYQVWKGRNQLKVREAEKLKGNVFRPPNTPTRCSTVDNIVKNANLLLLSMTKVLYISLHRHEGGKFYPGTGAAHEILARWNPVGACRPVIDEAPVFYLTIELVSSERKVPNYMKEA